MCSIYHWNPFLKHSGPIITYHWSGPFIYWLNRSDSFKSNKETPQTSNLQILKVPKKPMMTVGCHSLCALLLKVMVRKATLHLFLNLHAIWAVVHRHLFREIYLGHYVNKHKNGYAKPTRNVFLKSTAR